MVKAEKNERIERRLKDCAGNKGEEEDGLKQYQVTVCRFGTVVVEAESEEDAKTAAAKRRPEEIQWFGEKDHKPSFLVTYAEPLE